MKKINSIIDKNIEKILIIYLFSQPFIDVITAIMINSFNISFTIGVVIRFIFILFMIYYLLFINKSETKKRSIIYIVIIILYMLLFIINMISLRENSYVYEIKNLIKCFYFPIVLVSFYEVYKSKKSNISTNTFRNLFIIYCLFILIPNLLNIGFAAYDVTKEGSIGFFETANEVSAIISILLPLFIYDILKKKNIYLTIVISIILLYLLTSIGTKGPLLSLGIIVIYYLVKYFIKWIKNKNYKPVTISILLVLIALVSGILLIPKTTFYKNIKVHLEFLKVDEVSDLAKPKVFDHFVFSSRLKFWSKTNKVYEKSDITSKLLGIGYTKKNTKNMKTVEMDYVDIFYRHGIVGFIIYMSSLLYIIVVVFKNKKKTDIPYLLSIFLALLLAMLTGHVLTSPSVSIYVALLIVLFYNGFSKGVTND